jgi:hypothetical protein
VVLRTSGDPLRAVGILREQVFAIDRNQPLSDVKSMQEVVDSTIVRDRLSAVVLGVFAALALTLAAIGIDGVIACSVGPAHT